METMKDLKNTFLKTITISDDARHKLKEILPKLDESGDVLREIFSEVPKVLEGGFRGLILNIENEAQDFFSFKEIHELNPAIGSLFGELLVQNDQGDKVIQVYDRDRHGSMWQGSRYHQTREGGSIHTDNVNVPELWDYLYLSCLCPALVGGENILVDGLQVHHMLKEGYPEALKVLEEDFVWEMRGVADEMYRAPIITYNDKGEAIFRHLRPYMESAHVKANQPLTNEQLFAIDVLDALTNTSEYQIRYRMKKGDVLISKDAQVLHGRTCFSDAIEAVNYDEFYKGKGQVLKRTMERLWLKK